MPSESLTIGEPARDARGVLHYAVRSSYQGGAATDLRVLLPREPQGQGLGNILYMLPVEGDDRCRFGDGMAEALRLDLANRWRAVVVAPTFSRIDPWYGDHPSDGAVRQESYFVHHVVPAVDRLWPQASAARRRLLLGFSKSGWGAMSLILRHPELFAKAALWDAPLGRTTPYDFSGMPETFGTQENFDAYAIPNVLAARKGPFLSADRIWIGSRGGDADFSQEMQAIHDRMRELGIAHTFIVGPDRRHHWDSGWVEEAAAGILR